MIYLDNSATTYPKPESVRKAMYNAFRFAANPGRSGHRLSIKAAEEVYKCRYKISKLYSVANPENVILTPSCTFALNTVIKGVLSRGDHVVISSLEHNSVSRPLEKLRSKGIVNYSIAAVYEGDDDRTLDSFRQAIRDNTKLVVCTHASNVFGVKLPISRIGALCKYYGILFCVDAAQTAGILSINPEEVGADYVCAPGHKGLYGPMGTGFLIINSDIVPDTLCEGGTGSGSSDLLQPEMLPDKFESGTVNLCGISGLSAGIDFINAKGIDTAYKHETLLLSTLYSKISKMNRVKLYTSDPMNNTCVPLLSFNIDGIASDEVARILDSRFNIAVRAGMHCSPLAHKQYNTFDTGTVRISPSLFSRDVDMFELANAISWITKNKNISS